MPASLTQMPGSLWPGPGASSPGEELRGGRRPMGLSSSGALASQEAGATPARTLPQSPHSPWWWGRSLPMGMGFPSIWCRLRL